MSIVIFESYIKKMSPSIRLLENGYEYIFCQAECQECNAYSLCNENDALPSLNVIEYKIMKKEYPEYFI